MTTRQGGPETREIIGRGREADILAWGDGRVLKLYLSPERRGDAEREAMITAAVYDAGCPAPRCYGLAELGGRTGIVLERLYGPMLVDLLLADAHPETGLRRLAELQAQIHRYELPGLVGLHARLAFRARLVRSIAGAIADAAIDRLARLPEGRALCHLDLHPSNVMVTGRGLKVIDWSGAVTGNPLADVARTLFLLIESQLPDDTPEGVCRRVAEVRAAGAGPYLDRYCEITGATREDIASWRMPVLVDRLADDIPKERELLLRLAAAC